MSAERGLLRSCAARTAVNSWQKTEARSRRPPCRTSRNTVWYAAHFQYDCFCVHWIDISALAPTGRRRRGQRRRRSYDVPRYSPPVLHPPSCSFCRQLPARSGHIPVDSVFFLVATHFPSNPENGVLYCYYNRLLRLMAAHNYKIHIKHSNMKTNTVYTKRRKQYTKTTTKLTKIIKYTILKYARQMMQINRTVFCHFCMHHQQNVST